MTSKNIDQALQEWKILLGDTDVRTAAELEPYKINCLGLTRTILAALRPSTELEVANLVKIAARWHIPLYAVSTGRNWGYGTSLPVTESCVLVDLSRMNHILSMDAELGLVTLEPGVTQQQLFDYLKAHNLDFFVPTVGAGPSVSVMGNALERGFGMTPQEDHFGAASAIRAVLPNGDIYQSHLPSIGAATANGVWTWGVGPYLDGLFSQGNFGIVTSMQIALARRPEHTEVYIFTHQKETSLSEFIDHCRVMLSGLKGSLGPLKLMNRRQIEMTAGTDDVGMGFTPDYEWMGFGVIHTRKSMVRPIRAYVRKSLDGYLKRMLFMNTRRIQFLNHLCRLIPRSWGRRFQTQIGRLEELMSIMNGEPRGLELKMVYRYVPMPENKALDPIRDGVGLIWYAPIIPFKASVVVPMMSMMDETLKKHGFEPVVSLTVLNESCSIGVIPVIYKKPEQMEKAQACFEELCKRGTELGCFPYRLPISAMEDLTKNSSSTYWDMVDRLKSVMDPERILSPGRYARRPS